MRGWGAGRGKNGALTHGVQRFISGMGVRSCGPRMVDCDNECSSERLQSWEVTCTALSSACFCVYTGNTNSI